MKSYSLFCFLFFIGSFSFGQISNFDVDDDGWQLIGDPSSPIPFHSTTGGNPLGYCHFTESQAGVFVYWVAPSKFLGNKLSTFGSFLSYDLKQNYSSDQRFNSADVVLEGAGMTIYFDDTSTFNNGNPDTVWTHYETPLFSNNIKGIWELSYFGSGQMAPDSIIKQVLSNLTSIQIRGEFHGDQDFGSIDNVNLMTNSAGIETIPNSIAQINVYPNPAQEMLTISVENATVIQVYTLSGQIIEEISIVESNKNLSLDIRTYPAGKYMIKVDDRLIPFVKN